MKNYWINKANENQIQFIIENFDFHKVRKTMKGLKWSWTNGIPTVNDLITMAKDLLYHLVDNENSTEIACGGFRAEKINNLLRLSFCIEEMDGEFYND